MNGLISVIVPVYNVEKYLAECLRSIAAQTYRNLEILVVDDGSTDGSGAICDAFAKEDPRFRVFHKQNGGAASARNLALREARGEYLAFVDSDDVLHSDAYEHMVSQMQEHDADVVQCGYADWYRDEKIDQLTFAESQEFGAQDYLMRFTIDWTGALLWDKLYRRKLFDGIFFEEGHIIDDEFFTYQGLMNARRIRYVPRVVYHYRKRRSSVTINRHTQQRIVMDKLDYLPKRRVKVLSRFPALRQDYDYHYLSMLLILSRNCAATKESILEIKRQLKAYAKEKKPCKMEFALLRRLLWLCFASADAILKRREPSTLEEQQKECFE